jgi:Rrf2 family nitric oxide-sensitive transcriptional repressor
MKLTKQTDFAFRTLLFLAAKPKEQLSNIQQICDFYDISTNHISKVVMRLVRMGYIEAVRGKGGGIRLGCAPEHIQLINVVTEFETTLRPINCSEQPCRIIRNCRLKGVLGNAMQAFLDALSAYTLADIVDSDLEAIVFSN